MKKKTKTSLASSRTFETFVIDQLSGVGEVVARKMFGGVGLYGDGVFFGLIARDELYLKVDAAARGALEAEGGARPFKPYSDRPVTLQYYSVPIAVLESAPELVRWAERAIAAARAASGAATRRSSASAATKASSDRD